MLKQLNFKYLAEDQFNSQYGNDVHIELGLFHVNIRSLNSNAARLCQFLQLLSVNFDVIVLSEIWTTNINFFLNILPEYNFYYDIPKDSRVGGIGIFVKCNLKQQELEQFKIQSTISNRVENIWLEITKNKKKYIIGGVYRHPNQQVVEFRNSIEIVLNKLAGQKHPCFIAGDINIDLMKVSTKKNTSEYVDALLLNNFVPLVIMPTRITSRSATLIDHIYYYEGKNPKEFLKIETGNFLSDLSDYLPNYMLLINEKTKAASKRPTIRIFSAKHKEKFCELLTSTSWHTVCNENDANDAYNAFIKIITDVYDKSFPVVQLSKKRMKDKVWITSALKKAAEPRISYTKSGSAPDYQSMKKNTKTIRECLKS